MAQISKILGNVTVSTAGTRVQITSANTAVLAIIFQANSANSGKIYIGDNTVTSSTGIYLNAGDTYTVTPQGLNKGMDNELILSDSYLDADTNGNSCRIHYLVGKPRD